MDHGMKKEKMMYGGMTRKKKMYGGAMKKEKVDECWWYCMAWAMEVQQPN